MIDLVLENQVLMSNFVRPSRKRGRENGAARERLVCKNLRLLSVVKTGSQLKLQVIHNEEIRSNDNYFMNQKLLLK